MALFNECMQSCAHIVLDTADIVRDGDFTPTTNRPHAGIVPPVGLPTKPAKEGLVAGSVDCRPPKGSNFSTKVNP
jgi:hypothetical protein